MPSPPRRGFGFFLFSARVRCTCDLFPQVTIKELKSLANDLQVIVNYNTKLLKDLSPRVENWSPHQKLGDIFLQLGLFLKVYTQYVKDYSQARAELSTARKNSPEFAAYITELEKSNATRLDNKDIFAYLIMPVQRIPRYQLLLRDLLEHTEKEHVDYESLNKALEQIASVASYIEEKTEEAEHVHLVSTIQARFANKAENLVVPGRKFVKKGSLVVWSVKQKKRQPSLIFLFSDLLVTTKWSVSATGTLKRKKLLSGAKDLKFRASFQLKYLVPCSVPDDTKHKYCFGLNTEFGESVVRFFAENEEEKAEWLNELSAIKEKIDGDRAAREVIIKSLTRKEGTAQGRELKRTTSTVEITQPNDLLGLPQLNALQVTTQRPRRQSLLSDFPKLGSRQFGADLRPVASPASAPNTPTQSLHSEVDDSPPQPFRNYSCVLPKMTQRESLESSLKSTVVVLSQSSPKTKRKGRPNTRSEQ